MSTLKTYLAVVCAVVSVAGRPSVARSFSASEVLRESETTRTPEGDYSADFTIEVHDDRLTAPVRTSEFTMLVRGRDRAMVLMRAPATFFGGALLVDSGSYWLLLPNAEHPLQLLREQVIRGDIAAGDIARSNLLAEYRATLAGRDSIDGERCFRLELARDRDNARYRRIVAWVSQSKLQTRKLELYGASDAPLRTVRYFGFHRTQIGVLPDRISIASGADPHETTTIAFAAVRALDLRAVDFSPEGLVRFQQSAIRVEDSGRAAKGPQAIVADLLGVP